MLESLFVDQLSGLGWHHQLFGEHDEPRQYAQSRRVDGDWRTRWIGGSWLTRRVDRAIRRLDRIADHESGPVDLIWLDFGRRRHVHLLRLKSTDQYAVASVTRSTDQGVWLGPEKSHLIGEPELRSKINAEITRDQWSSR